MKKIGLLTFHESENYGTCLQAFSLMYVLKKISGCNVDILRFYRRNVVRKSKLSKIKTLLGLILHFEFDKLVWIIFCRKKISNIKRKFQSFREKYYSYSSLIFENRDDFLKHEKDYDAYVVGSDMVWASTRAQPLDLFFLSFAQPYKRIAYAPSIGSVQIPSELKNEYKTLLTDFPHISCREQIGCDLIQKLTGKKVPLVADPTLLLSKEEWIKIFDLSESKNERSPYFLSYLFDGIPRKKIKIIDNFCKENKMAKYVIPMSPYEHLMNKNEMLDPVDFVCKIKDSSFVLTNSYHGLVFSIIFRKPFCVLARPQKAFWSQFEDRLSNLLILFNLEQRLISDISNLNHDHLFLDYTSIENKINEFVKKSFTYLNSSITDSFKND